MMIFSVFGVAATLAAAAIWGALTRQRDDAGLTPQRAREEPQGV